MPPRYPRLIAAALLIICVAWPCALQVEAKARKRKTSVSRSHSQSSKRYVSKRSKRSVSKRGKRSRHRVSNKFSAADLAVNRPVVPDHIEVLEHGATSSTEMARYLNPPAPRTQPLQNSAGPVATIKPKRRSVRIESSRAIQIQQALASRGFYSGQMTGNYDEATIDAMRRFQASQKIAATGYPTAHALKRLGLANW